MRCESLIIFSSVVWNGGNAEGIIVAELIDYVQLELLITVCSECRETEFG